jgi:flavin reductase (DIM6/NTAB) family NADH-FMN oxidoreductase RutF
MDQRCSVGRHFESNRFFAINLLRDDQEHLSIKFSANADVRFDGVEWKSGQTQAPLLAGTLGSLECAVANRIVAGDHTIILGEVLSALAVPGNPLIYFDSRYKRLQPE